MLHNMLWPDEVRDPGFEFLDQQPQVRKQELEMAKSLVDSMAGDFDPDQFDDGYRDAMRRLIEAKAEGAELPERPEPQREEVVDLMTALQRSVEAAKASGRSSASKRSTRPGSAKPESSKSGSTRRKHGSTNKRSA